MNYCVVFGGAFAVALTLWLLLLWDFYNNVRDSHNKNPSSFDY